MDTHWGMESHLCWGLMLESHRDEQSSWIVKDGIRRLLSTSERAMSLDRYILAYLRTRGLTRSAATFAHEAHVNNQNAQVEDGLNIFWTACYEQRLRIQTAVDHKLSERRAKGLVQNDSVAQQHQLLSLGEPSTNEHTSTRNTTQGDAERTSTSNTTQGDAYSVDDQVFTFQKEQINKGKKHKLFSCSFSSNGELLACAGTMGEVLLWNISSRTPLPSVKLPKTIANVCFQPNSTFLAASCGSEIYFCDSTKVSEAPVILIGHAKPTEPELSFYIWPVIKSVDFCPTDSHLLCSCDSHGEIHIWNVERHAILCRLEEAGCSQVRFGPGNVLAVAIGSRIMLLSLIHMDSGDVKEKSRFYLEGHLQEVNSMCWDKDYKRLASVSNNSAQVWALRDNEWTCHYKLPSDDYVYKCCIFHPLYPQVLIIGSYQYLHLWDTSKASKPRVLQSETSGFVSALTGSAECKLVASASHDGKVHVWTSLP